MNEERIRRTLSPEELENAASDDLLAVQENMSGLCLRQAAKSHPWLDGYAEAAAMVRLTKSSAESLSRVRSVQPTVQDAVQDLQCAAPEQYCLL